jgi:hypothetical protein
LKKREAIQFIQRELRNNHSQEEITQALSQQLGAPPEVVQKFVAQVAAQPAQPAPSDSPSPQSSTAQPPASQSSFSSPDSLYAQPAAASALDRYSYSQEQPAPPTVYKPGASAVAEIEQRLKDEELHDTVIKALIKGRKNSDIVLAVCERTGANWDQAQRLVARISAENRKQLSNRYNIVIVPISSLAVLAGLVLIFASVNEGQTLYNDLQNLGENPYVLEVIVRELLWGITIGIALILGGAAGLFRVLQSRVEN